MNHSGLLLIDKRPGFTSSQVVTFIKRKLNLKKVGHAGTLDPLATGLLVLLVGEATKLSEKCMKGQKCYTGTFKFGVTANTDDSDGEVKETGTEIPDFETIKVNSKNFTGIIQQTPPNFSAIKIEGRKAYDIARSGKESPKLMPRSVEVHDFTIEPTDDKTLFIYDIKCSSGTYIRSIARDLGQLLGCGGIVQTLRRESSEPFNVKDAKDEHDATVYDIIDPAKIFTF